MIRATSRTVALLAATLTISIVIPVTAGARTISDVRAEAARIERQIQENGDRIAALGEQYNGAVLSCSNSPPTKHARSSSFGLLRPKPVQCALRWSRSRCACT